MIPDEDRNLLKQPVKQDVDMTEHDLDKHRNVPRKLSRAMYVFWGGKCPVCHTPAKIVRE